MMPLYFYNATDNDQVFCINSKLDIISYADFWQDVAEQSTAIKNLKQQSWALWQQDSYEFSVLFFAALLAHKKIILPPNRVRDLEQQLAEQGIGFLNRQRFNQHTTFEKDEIWTAIKEKNFLEQSNIVFYTSGSTGEPKQIERTLQQLLNEVQGLANSFQFAQDCVAIATVSHQHIYGLLFKILLPLATGR